MANIIKIQEYGNNLAVLLDDNTKLICYTTGNGLWVPGEQRILVTPATPTFSSNTITIPSVIGVLYQLNGVNVENGSTHTISSQATVRAIPESGFRFPDGIYQWTFTPTVSSSFKFPFPRSQHTSYPGHSGADWPVNTNIPCIGNGTVVQRFAYSGNTYPNDSSEPIWRGNCLVINHGSIGGHQIWSLYAHMRDAPSLSEGDNVNGGQIIGHTGNTGYSAGIHLHFEIIYDGVRLQTGQGGYERTMSWMDANTDGSSW